MENSTEFTGCSLILNAPGIPSTKTVENGRALETEEDKKPEKEHKKRSKNWTRLETLKLIELRSHLAPRFARAGRKSELWDEIAEALQSRDAQQCRDKWEKLMAAYKEVRDGLKEREDNPYYDELHSLLSGSTPRREKEKDVNLFPQENSDTGEDCNNPNMGWNNGDNGGEALEFPMEEDIVAIERIKVSEQRMLVGKRKRDAKATTSMDLDAVQSLLEAIISKQQRFFEELLDAMEQKQQERERMCQEREDKWRAEERAQRCIFNNAMLVLTQKLVGERLGASIAGVTGSLIGNHVENQGPKKRSKNWKRTEVLQLIRLRGEMESRFAKSTRRAALWDELADMLATQGIQRDGKQCREKWDKLMCEHKDVVEGKREQSDSPYFSELTALVGRKPGDTVVD